MDMIGQMVQSPAMQQLAGQMFGEERQQGVGASGGNLGNRGPGPNAGGADLGAMMQQMMPMVSQVGCFLLGGVLKCWDLGCPRLCSGHRGSRMV